MYKLILTICLIIPALAQAEITRTKQYLLQVASNEIHEKNNEITQKELQETIRFIHVDMVTTDQMLQLKDLLKSDDQYLKLNSSTQIEIQKLLSDLADVMVSMDEWKAKGLWCRFTLRDNPWEEVSEDSFLKNPEAYWGLMPDEEVRKTINARYERGAIAQCYSSVESDYLYRLGINPKTLQPL